MDKIRLCEYGCGQEAKYQLKNGRWSSCPGKQGLDDQYIISLISMNDSTSEESIQFII